MGGRLSNLEHLANLFDIQHPVAVEIDLPVRRLARHNILRLRNNKNNITVMTLIAEVDWETDWSLTCSFIQKVQHVHQHFYRLKLQQSSVNEWMAPTCEVNKHNHTHQNWPKDADAASSRRCPFLCPRAPRRPIARPQSHLPTTEWNNKCNHCHIHCLIFIIIITTTSLTIIFIFIFILIGFIEIFLIWSTFIFITWKII